MAEPSSRWVIIPQTFERLAFGRNTERSRRAIQLARLIILNYSPDLHGGREHVIAILPLLICASSQLA
jgi:5-methylcytosine-specific restriction enzyme subunit McrC